MLLEKVPFLPFLYMFIRQMTIFMCKALVGVTDVTVTNKACGDSLWGLTLVQPEDKVTDNRKRM